MKAEEAIRLRALVNSFRTAIVRTDRSKLPISLRDFPAGSCGDACLLLAKFLDEAGCGLATYVAASRGPYSHAWLELGGLQIDISADQFFRDPEKLLWTGRPLELRDGVIVSTDRTWHAGFDDESRHLADIRYYDARTQAILNHAYREILANI